MTPLLFVDGELGRPPPPPPSGGDAQLWSWFTAVDTDKSGQLTVDELQRALVNGDWSPFNIETVRTMVNMFDTGKPALPSLAATNVRLCR